MENSSNDKGLGLPPLGSGSPLQVLAEDGSGLSAAIPKPPAHEPKYTAHVAGYARHWHPVVKLNGKEVWRGDAVPNRDYGSGHAAKQLSRMVVTALTNPNQMEKDKRWASFPDNKYGASSMVLYKWAEEVAAAITKATSNP